MKLGCLLPLGAVLLSGCMMVVVHAPNARNAAVQVHEQAATNIVNTSNVPITQKAMDKVADRVIGAKTVGDVNTSAKLK